MTTTLAQPKNAIEKGQTKEQTTLHVEIQAKGSEVFGDDATVKAASKLKVWRRGFTADETAQMADALTLTITDETSYLRATQLVVALKNLQKRVGTWYESALAPIRIVGTVIRNWKTGDSDAVESAWSKLDRKAIDWKNEQQRKEDEERRQKEAQARRQAEADRLAKVNELRQAAKGETNQDLRKALNQEAAQVSAAPVTPHAVVVERRVPKAPGYSTRTYYSAELDATAGGLAALVKAVAAGEEPLEMLCLNQTAANQRAVDQKDEFKLAGCKLVKRDGSASR